jgi:hypothetical protein
MVGKLLTGALLLGGGLLLLFTLTGTRKTKMGELPDIPGDDIEPDTEPLPGVGITEFPFRIPDPEGLKD